MMMVSVLIRRFHARRESGGADTDRYVSRRHDGTRGTALLQRHNDTWHCVCLHDTWRCMYCAVGSVVAGVLNLGCVGAKTSSL